jgi:hypothetical protein
VLTILFALTAGLCSAGEAVGASRALIIVDADPALGPGWAEAMGSSAGAVLALAGWDSEMVWARRPAEPRKNDARREVGEGIAAYDAMRYEAALAHLDAAATAAGASGGAGLDRSQLSDIYLFRGMVRRELGDAASAFDDFVRAARFAPGRTLDPGRFPPAAREAHARAEAAVAAAGRSTLRVTGPAGARAFIDGSDMGPVPVRCEGLPRGEHFVRVELSGREPWVTRVTLSDPEATVRADPAPRRPAIDPRRPEGLAAAGRARSAQLVIAVAVSAAADGGAEIAWAAIEVGKADKLRRGKLTLKGGPAEAGPLMARVLSELNLRRPRTDPAPPPTRPRAGPLARAAPVIAGALLAALAGGLVAAAYLVSPSGGDGFVVVVDRRR